MLSSKVILKLASKIGSFSGNTPGLSSLGCIRALMFMTSHSVALFITSVVLSFVSSFLPFLTLFFCYMASVHRCPQFLYFCFSWFRSSFCCVWFGMFVFLVLPLSLNPEWDETIDLKTFCTCWLGSQKIQWKDHLVQRCNLSVEYA